MRNLPDLAPYLMAGMTPSTEGGAYEIHFPPTGVRLVVIASTGHGWDHVSVSTASRCPTWDELEHVKRLFFLPHETAVQFHVPPREHVNIHPYCLHLWRYQYAEFPRPPSWMVG